MNCINHSETFKNESIAMPIRLNIMGTLKNSKFNQPTKKTKKKQKKGEKNGRKKDIVVKAYQS